MCYEDNKIYIFIFGKTNTLTFEGGNQSKWPPNPKCPTNKQSILPRGNLTPPHPEYPNCFMNMPWHNCPKSDLKA